MYMYKPGQIQRGFINYSYISYNIIMVHVCDEQSVSAKFYLGEIHQVSVKNKSDKYNTNVTNWQIQLVDAMIWSESSLFNLWPYWDLGKDFIRSMSGLFSNQW